MKIYAGLILAGLTTAVSLGQISQSGGGYLLRTKYVKGQNFKYAMKSATKMQKQTMAFEAPMSIKVVNVVNGIAELYTTFGPANMGGQQIPVSHATMKVDNRGRPISGGAGSVSATFPEKPVKVGQTWSGDFNMAKAGAMGAAKATYVFKGLKTIGKTSLAEVSISVATDGKAGQSAAMSSKGGGTMLLSAADGQLYSLTMSMTLTMGGGKGQQPMVMPTTLTLKRL